jgi:hypothetical protein
MTKPIPTQAPLRFRLLWRAEVLINNLKQTFLFSTGHSKGA